MYSLTVMEVERQSTPTTKTLVVCGPHAIFTPVGGTVTVAHPTKDNVADATVDSITKADRRVTIVATMADAVYDTWIT